MQTYRATSRKCLRLLTPCSCGQHTKDLATKVKDFSPDLASLAIWRSSSKSPPHLSRDAERLHN